MITVTLERPDDAVGWRVEARRLLADGAPPESVVWVSGDDTAGSALASGDLFSHNVPAPADESADRVITRSNSSSSTHRARVPASFIDLAERVACHRDPQRFAVLYRVLWRQQHGEPRLLERLVDPDVHQLYRWSKAVSRDRHKMTAFVRFRRSEGLVDEHYSAWFEPDHFIVRLTAGFFQRRFNSMRFSIFTPYESVHWDGVQLAYSDGGERGCVPRTEAMEDLWREYFASTFNPSRLKLDAMRAEMPVKYWKNLPEAPLIAELTRRAGYRSAAMIDAPATQPPRYAAAAASMTTSTRAHAGDPARRSATRGSQGPAGTGTRSSDTPEPGDTVLLNSGEVPPTLFPEP